MYHSVCMHATRCYAVFSRAKIKEIEMRKAKKEILP